MAEREFVSSHLADGCQHERASLRSFVKVDTRVTFNI